MCARAHEGETVRVGVGCGFVRAGVDVGVGVDVGNWVWLGVIVGGGACARIQTDMCRVGQKHTRIHI